jgi:sporulation protein YlmC with PRC-barrel domain
MRISEAHHRQVVATTTASKIGRVEGFVLEPAPHVTGGGSAGAARISALRVGDSVLSWSDLKAFGQDAVTVADDSGLRRPRDEAEAWRSDAKLDILGKLALIETGEAVGEVRDVEFDPGSGSIRAIITTHAEIPGSALIGLGSYAAVFAAPD